MSASSQSIDEKIGLAMNSSNWFELDSLYNSAPKDSINPFLEIFSRCLIGNRLNRTDVSIPAFQELFNTQQLGLGNVVSSAQMFGIDLSREGYNAEAASMINSIIAQTEQYLDSAAITELTFSASRYAALADYKLYQIEFPKEGEAVIPFSIVPVGPKDKGSVHIHLTNCTINDNDADITFDTGAGVNMASQEMAEKYNLIPLENAKITVGGIGNSDGYLAIAKEINLGNIIVREVPFVVASMSSHNEEADAYINSFNLILGSELMLKLKNLTLDFSKNQITIAKEVEPRRGVAPNLCFSSGMNLLTKGAVMGYPSLMCLDSGDASFGSVFSNFYELHPQVITAAAHPDTIRAAGVGGVVQLPCYCVPDVSVTMGGNSVTPSDLLVYTHRENSDNYDVRIGLRTMMLFDRVNFNMVDFIVTTFSSEN